MNQLILMTNISLWIIAQSIIEIYIQSLQLNSNS
jgi:hypothetical protein